MSRWRPAMRHDAPVGPATTQPHGGRLGWLPGDGEFYPGSHRSGIDSAGVSESRQQRRARERRAAKEATRAGPNTPAAPPERREAKRERVVDIELYRLVIAYGPAEIEVSWSAEWGLRDDGIGTEDSNENLAELVEAVLEDLRPLSERYTLRLEWELGGDPPKGKTLEDAVAERDVTLPQPG